MRISTPVIGTFASVMLAVAMPRAAVAQTTAPAQALPDWSGIWNPHELNIFDPTAPRQAQNKKNSSAADMREFPPYNSQWEEKMPAACPCRQPRGQAD